MRRPQFDPNWPEDVKAVYRHDLQEFWDRTMAPHIWNQYHNLLDVYLSLAGGESRRILDVGCAQATLALLLAERGHEVWALDLRPQFLDYAKSRYTHGRITFVCCDVLKADFTSQFDLIFANQIIEHLVCPGRLAAKLHGWLRDGGVLAVSTPNGFYLRNRLPSFSDLGDPLQYEHRQFTADGDGHFFAYLESELQGIMKSVGFADLETCYMETPWISGHMRIRYLHRCIPARLLRILDRATLRVPHLRRLLAHQIMVVGYKRALGSCPA